MKRYPSKKSKNHNHKKSNHIKKCFTGSLPGPGENYCSTFMWNGKGFSPIESEMVASDYRVGDTPVYPACWRFTKW